MRLHSPHVRPDTFFLVSLFLFFALTAGTLVLLGAGQYRATVTAMEQNTEVRTVNAYLTQKVRHADGAVSVVQFCGLSALAFPETTGSVPCVTYLYYYDHTLRELLVRTDSTCDPSMGQAIASLSAFSVEDTGNGLLSVTYTDSANHARLLHLYVRRGIVHKEDL